MSTAHFWSRYEQLTGDLARPLTPEDQLPEPEVSAAEQRLGIRFPSLLREYYLRAGRFSEINRAFNRLLPPDELALEGEWLVFYEEHQGAFIWGIRRDDCHAEDPPVHQGAWNSASGEWSWQPGHLRLPEFFIAMFYWQLANSEAYGVQEQHTSQIDEEALARVRLRCIPEDLPSGTIGFAVYRCGHAVLWVLPDADRFTLWVAGQSDEEIAGLCTELGLRSP